MHNTPADYGAELDLDRDFTYQVESAKLRVAGLLASRLEECGLTRTEFARNLGVSASRVTQILAGYENLTLETIVAAALALDSTVQFDLWDLVEPEAPTRAIPWEEVTLRANNDAGTNRQLAQAA